MLDSPEGVCPGQAGFKYPATSALFSNWTPGEHLTSTLTVERDPQKRPSAQRFPVVC
jgi:hypothetical protein